MRSGRSGRPERPEDRLARQSEPAIPEGVSASDLDRVTLNSLRTLPDGLAELVARHLAAAIAVLPDDPDAALAHARAAARRAGRVAVVREAVGVAAYQAGDYGSALSELKAAARISGSSEYLPMIADCERGLGRPERALSLASSPEASLLDRQGKVELLIVAAGARRDLGQGDAAVLTLQVPALNSRTPGEWLVRLRYAYADALLGVGRVGEARQWFARAAEADPAGATDAAERRDELDGITFDEVVEADEADEVQRGAGSADGVVESAAASADGEAVGIELAAGSAVDEVVEVAPAPEPRAEVESGGSALGDE